MLDRPVLFNVIPEQFPGYATVTLIKIGIQSSFFLKQINDKDAFHAKAAGFSSQQLSFTANTQKSR